MTDPALQWSGSSSLSSGELVLAAGDSAVSGARGGTKAGAIAMAALIPGGVVAAVALATAAAVTRKQGLLKAAAMIMFAETLVIFTLAPLTFVNGVAYLWWANRLRGQGVRGGDGGQGRAFNAIWKQKPPSPNRPACPHTSPHPHD